jgi:hypothetical protein
MRPRRVGDIEGLAARLNWKLWDEEFTARLAARLKCEPKIVEQHEKRVDSMSYRLIKTFMRGSFERRTDTEGMELLDAENLVVLFENTSNRRCSSLRAYCPRLRRAASGCVIS